MTVDADGRPPKPPRDARSCLLCPCLWRSEQWRWPLADERYRTCTPCVERLAQWLRELAEDYAALDPEPPRGGSSGWSPPGPRSPAADRVLALTDRRHGAVVHADDIPSVPGTLLSWVRLVAEEGGPVSQPETTVEGLIGDLSNALTWITRQGWVDEFERELGELRAAVRGHRPRMSCACGYPLWAPPDARVAHCKCGAAYDRSEWAGLRRGSMTA